MRAAGMASRGVMMSCTRPWTELEELALKELWVGFDDEDTMDRVGLGML